MSNLWAYREPVRGIELKSLPSYAPELNPVEPSWSQSKYGDLPNYTPEDLVELEQAVCQSLRRQRGNQAFFAVVLSSG